MYLYLITIILYIGRYCYFIPFRRIKNYQCHPLYYIKIIIIILTVFIIYYNIQHYLQRIQSVQRISRGGNNI